MHASDLQLTRQRLEDRRHQLMRDHGRPARETRRAVRQWQRALVRG
ncbi:MAG: hypothetical protein AB7Q42_12010 [Acidimicrobiia bacterium]